MTVSRVDLKTEAVGLTVDDEALTVELRDGRTSSVLPDSGGMK